MIVVSNASPLIVLSGVGLFSLLHDLFETIHITDLVYDEVARDAKGRAGSVEIEQAKGKWVSLHPSPSQTRSISTQLSDNLTHADVSVIALATQKHADLVLADDRGLRRAVTDAQLPLAGTGEVLIRAKRAGLIASVREPLQQSVVQGLRLHDRVLQEILAKADELSDQE